LPRMLLGLTGGEITLLVVAGVFIVFALTVSMLVPRNRPGFPGRHVGLFVFVTLLLFAAMMVAVVTSTAGEEHAEEAAVEETEPAGTGTEPAETETEPAETETGETETGETETGETETGEEEGGGDAAAGEQVFASAGCGSCHTLAAAGTNGTVGPNLDDAKPPASLVVERVTNGKGAMPSFKDQLSEQQIQDVAAYVAESTSG
jgi:mono/diheme cytochrome c family protein